MKKFFIVSAVLFCLASVIGASEISDIIKTLPAPVKKQAFGKFVRYNFTFDGTGATLVVPQKPAPGNHWIWRARFFGHQPQTDLALLEKGWFVAYINVGGLFGAPKAVERWNKFYDFLTQKCKLSPRPVLEGMSRGGLIIFNWAKRIPIKLPPFMPMLRCAISRAGRAAKVGAKVPKVLTSSVWKRMVLMKNRPLPTMTSPTTS